MASSDYFIINSQFRPFSYEEMVIPVEQANQEFYTIQEKLGELDAQSSIWENLINKSQDPEVYEQYKGYSDTLKSQADKLLQYGLTPNSRRDLLKMRSLYSSQILPIENAYTRRQQLLDEQRQALQKNPTLIYNLDMNDVRLKDLIDNPTLQPESISGALLTQQVSEQVAPLAKQIVQDVREGGAKANEWKSILGDQYFEKVYRTGFEPDDIYKAMRGQGPKILVDAVQQAINSSGVRAWNNEDALRQAYQYANKGLFSAIGQTDYKTLQNKQWDFNKQVWLARQKQGEEPPTLPGISGSNVELNTLPQNDKLITQYQEDINNLDKIGLTIAEDGSLVIKSNLTPEESKELASLYKQQGEIDPATYSGKNSETFAFQYLKKQRDIKDRIKELETKGGLQTRAADIYEKYKGIFTNVKDENALKQQMQVAMMLEARSNFASREIGVVPNLSPNNEEEHFNHLINLVRPSKNAKLKEVSQGKNGKLEIKESDSIDDKESIEKFLSDKPSIVASDLGVIYTNNDKSYILTGVPEEHQINTTLQKGYKFLSDYTDIDPNRWSVPVRESVNSSFPTNNEVLKIIYNSPQYSFPIEGTNMRGVIENFGNGVVAKTLLIPSSDGTIIPYSSNTVDILQGGQQLVNTKNIFGSTLVAGDIVSKTPQQVKRQAIDLNKY